MKLGVVADDFTGASDIALTLAEGGMRVTQYVGTPAEQADNVDAGVIALKSRTMPADLAVAASTEACDWLITQGCTQIIFKICSTFDSTDEGNIGPVLAALGERLGENRIAVCPAFPENGRSVYQGHLFVGDCLLSESGMQNHPLTPMHDPDLRRVLSRQTEWPIGHIAARTVSAGREAIAEAMNGESAMIIIDAISDENLIEIGAALKDRKLLCGGSGIALGLPANFGHARGTVDWSGVAGKAVILSGSCSQATRNQVQHYRKLAPSLEIDAREVMAGLQTAESIADWVVLQSSEAPLVYSSADPERVMVVQNEFGREAAAKAIETLFMKLASELASRGVTRFVSAGGETSGAVVAGLSASALQIGPRIAPGVPALRVEERNMAIALKSGNFGDVDFFLKALNTLAGRT